jgi:hypothetical protein
LRPKYIFYQASKITSSNGLNGRAKRYSTKGLNRKNTGALVSTPPTLFAKPDI